VHMTFITNLQVRWGEGRGQFFYHCCGYRAGSCAEGSGHSVNYLAGCWYGVHYLRPAAEAGRWRERDVMGRGAGCLERVRDEKQPVCGLNT
jgi:hypothetical protein